MSGDETYRRLQRKLARISKPGVPRSGAAEGVLRTGVASLDRFFAACGIQRGSLVEWVAGEGSGVRVLTLAIASRLQHAGALAVIDQRGEFYPPAAKSAGVNLDQVIVVRPEVGRNVLWSLEQSLRCPGVAVTWCCVREIDDRSFRRLKLATESGGGVGFLVRPWQARQGVSWADVRLLVRSEALPNPGPLQRRVHVEVLYRRGGRSNESVEVDIYDDQGVMRLAAPMGDTTRHGRAS